MTTLLVNGHAYIQIFVFNTFCIAQNRELFKCGMHTSMHTVPVVVHVLRDAYMCANETLFYCHTYITRAKERQILVDKPLNIAQNI